MIGLGSLLPISSAAQSDAIKAQRAKWLAADEDSSRMQALYDLTYEFFNSSLDSAKIYAKKCVDISRNTNYKKFVCNCLSVMGTTYLYLNDYDSAQYFYEAALEAAEKYDQPDRMSALYSNFGVLYKRQELYDKAAASYLDGLVIDQASDNYYGMVIKKINLANLYSTISDNARALHFAEEALDDCVFLEDRPDQEYIQGFILNTIGTIFIEQGQGEHALEKFKEALKINQSIDNENEVARNLHNIGATLEKIGQTENGVPHLLEALSIRSTVGDQIGMFETHMQLGTSYAKIHDRAKSSLYFESALEIADAIENHTLWSQLYLAMSQATQTLDDHVGSLEYYKLYHAHSDSVNRQYDRDKYLELETKYETARKDATITQQDLVISQQKATRYLYLLGLGLLGLGLSFLWYRNRKNKSFNQAQIENLRKEHQLAAMTYVVEGQDQERKRIARDLHDGLGGMLSSIKLKFDHGGSDQPDQAGLLTTASNMIDEACTEVRRISHDMMPGTLIHLGFIHAVEDYLEDMEQSSGMQIQFEHNLAAEVNDRQSVNLFRVVQEILNNAVKYSQADEIVVRIWSNNQDINVNISDNGVGFDQEKAGAKNGIGLKNIEARIAMLNGDLKMRTAEGEGCRYEIRIPIMGE